MGSRTDSSASSSPSGDAERRRWSCAVGAAASSPPPPSEPEVEISDSEGEGARAGMVIGGAGCLNRLLLGGGLCGDEGGLEIRVPPRDEAGDGERSGAVEEARRRDGVVVAEDVLGAPAALSTNFLRGIFEIGRAHV